MAVHEQYLRTYNLDAALKADYGHDCVVMDVAPDKCGPEMTSLVHLYLTTKHLLRDIKRLKNATKLYVVGDWSFARSPGQGILTQQESKVFQTSTGDSWVVIDTISGDPALAQYSHPNESQEEREWSQGISMLIEPMLHMASLKEFTWISTLPFTPLMLRLLPFNLTSLTIDIGNPISFDITDNHKPCYISQAGMQPLIKYNHLTSLRVLGMRESFQRIIWETVFRNKNMQVLDMQMYKAPMIREPTWVKGGDVVGLVVSNNGIAQYKGKDGNGTLFHMFGHSEYLDDWCISKARMASGRDEDEGSDEGSEAGSDVDIPLMCLKLDGFVVDHLPFQSTLAGVVAVTCGEKCVNAGMRPPTGFIENKIWSKYVNGADSHCVIQWPDWAGVFDSNGRQRDARGKIATIEADIFQSFDKAPLGSDKLLLKDQFDPKDIDLRDIESAMQANSIRSASGSVEPASAKSPDGPVVDKSAPQDHFVEKARRSIARLLNF